MCRQGCIDIYVGYTITICEEECFISNVFLNTL